MPKRRLAFGGMTRWCCPIHFNSSLLALFILARTTSTSPSTRELTRPLIRRGRTTRLRQPFWWHRGVLFIVWNCYVHPCRCACLTANPDDVLCRRNPRNQY